MSASKREELVQGALEAFYRGGFHAIGMDRLAKETGVSKTAIYKHFRTKEDLILATLRLRDEQFRNWFVRRVEALADAPRAQLLVSFDVLGEWLEEPNFRSCMFIKASSEYQDRSHPIHGAAAEHKKLLFGLLRDLADAAGAKRPGDLAGQLQLIQEGAIVMAHLKGPAEAAADAKKAAATLIDAHIPS